MTRKIYQLKIELLDTTPLIWRSVKVNGNATFENLHYIIQIVMGWENCHLYEFITNNMRIAELQDPELEFNLNYIDTFESKDSEEITIEEVLKRKGSKIKYVYDFGDNWEHLITVEAVENGILLHGAVCISGERDCPPEECGGTWGYMEMQNALSDPKHPEYEEFREWLGYDFDPEYFDLEKTNEILVDFNTDSKID